MISKTSIPKGALLNKSMITYKNPGTGIPPKKEELLIGKIAKFNILEDELLSFDMFE